MTQATTQLRPADLVRLAIAETDFLGDLDHHTLADNAANSIDLVCELWEDRHGASLPLALMIEARAALFERGWIILCRRELEAANALADGIESGDMDARGAPAPYDRYYGGI